MKKWVLLVSMAALVFTFIGTVAAVDKQAFLMPPEPKQIICDIL